MSVLQWDTTAANNASSDAAINWAEGQAPSTVNNSARAMMAEIAKWLKDTSGSITSGGTADALTLTTNMTIASHATPIMLTFEASATNTGAATVTINALASRDIKRTDGSALQAGDITTGGIYMIAYESGIDDYLLLNPTDLKIATQAQMETGTSTAVLVTPGRQHFHPGHPKCWAMVTVSAGTPTLTSSYNITSITDRGTGELTVTIATDFSSADWCCVTGGGLADTSMDSSSDARMVFIGTIAAGSVELNCSDDANASSFALTDPASWHMVGFGDQT